jgi:hypothetical protein
MVNAVAPLRVSTRDEGLGLDVSQHGEEAYVRGEGALLILRDALPPKVSVPVVASAVGLGVLEGRS